MWTRRLMRTAFIFLVTMTTLARELDGNVEEWIRVDDGMTMESVWALEAGENRLYAGASNGFFISQDHGRTWRATLFKEQILTITIDLNTVYAGTVHQGVFRSDDAGKTWKPIRDGLRFYGRDDGERRYGKVRRILVTRDKITNVMYHDGTYTSTDWGETWHDVSEEWLLGDSIYSMTEFDGYLWSSISLGRFLRSPDHGQTWKRLPDSEIERVIDWAVLNNRLYVAGEEGIGRWNEETQAWEYLMKGLPTGSHSDPDDPPWVSSLAVNRGRLFAGLSGHMLPGRQGVYVFDARAEIWSSVSLDELAVYALLSHESFLYAGAGSAYDDIYGIYRARIPI